MLLLKTVTLDDNDGSSGEGIGIGLGLAEVTLDRLVSPEDPGTPTVGRAEEVQSGGSLR